MLLGARQFFARRNEKLPYDAEVEYLESTGTQWIVPDFSFKDADGEILEIWCTAMSTFDDSPNTISRGIVCNNLSTDASSTGSAVSIQFYWAQTWRTGCNGWGNIQGASSVAGNRTCYVKLDRASNEIYREIGTYSGTVTDSRFAGPFTGIPYVLFANSANGDLPYPARIWSVKFAIDGVIKRDLIPVRVGSVGYMYDKVTRRLFGNQGTGDFVLGRDINPISARSYVKDGLVAMWDGIENAGWGTHDANNRLTNLVANGLFGDISGGTIAANYLDINTRLGSSVSSNLSDYMTVEWCGDYTNSSHTQYSIFSFPGTGTSSSVGAYSWDAQKPLRMFRSIIWPTITDAPITDDRLATTLAVAFRRDTQSTTDNMLYVMGCKGEVKSTSNATTSYAITSSGKFYVGANGFPMKVHCARIYSRALTAEEIAANYAIDKARFNLP